MKRLLALAVSALALSVAAHAADLPVRTAPVPPAYVPPIPVFTWTGFHVGGNAGYAFDQQRTNGVYLYPGSIAGSPETNGVLALDKGSTDGFTGGLQVGYDYQFPSGLGAGPFGGLPGLGNAGVVLGVEADAQYLGIGSGAGRGGYAFAPAGGDPANLGAFAFGPDVYLHRRDDRFFGTVRGRLGLAIDRVLAYGTGGFAYNGDRVGYTYGGGLSYAFTNNVAVGVEYLRVNLDRGYGSYGSYDGYANVVDLNVNGGRDSFNVVRGKLDFKFPSLGSIGSFANPVAARY